VHVLVVVLAKLLLFLRRPRPEWLRHVSLCILAADHEPDLTGWVGRDGGVRILSDWEDFLAGLLQSGDERKVKPLVLG